MLGCKSSATNPRPPLFKEHPGRHEVGGLGPFVCDLLEFVGYRRGLLSCSPEIFQRFVFWQTRSRSFSASSRLP
jgi:hypothetical protein